jgi:hypothetical protein
MSLDSSAKLPAFLAFLALLLSAVFHYARQYYRLSHIPGPFLARFSNIPRIWWVYNRDAHNVHITQHRQYASRGSKWAPLVRYGPNAVSVGTAAAVETIYRMRGDPLLKSDFYSVIPPVRSFWIQS